MFISRNLQLKLSYCICSIFEILRRGNFEYAHRAKYHNSDFLDMINLKYFHDNKRYHAPHNVYDFRIHAGSNN